MGEVARAVHVWVAFLVDVDAVGERQWFELVEFGFEVGRIGGVGPAKVFLVLAGRHGLRLAASLHLRCAGRLRVRVGVVACWMFFRNGFLFS